MYISVITSQMDSESNVAVVKHRRRYDLFQTSPTSGWAITSFS
jgi:hypothetical protein